MEQIQKQNYEEKFKMYNKLSKKELIQMLIQANEVISLHPIRIYPNLFSPEQTPINPYPWDGGVTYNNTDKID